ncbi:peptidase inhibitor family I36 protein [Streptosporangium amethystogenes]|uniref:peptidase inhibitor family I36 protein n=1 Tax=Streptosporangium amethystogenes TaxID=2002 RepID=UPI0037BC210C
MIKIRHVLTASVAAAALIALVPAPSLAEPSPFAPSGLQPVQDQIDAQLKASPGGTQTGPNEISWNNGRVKMTFSAGEITAPRSVDAAAATNWHGCVEDYFCFYENENFNERSNGTTVGRRLQFSDCHWQYFVDWGFQDKTTSWVNRKYRPVTVQDSNPNDQYWTLWTEANRSVSGNVGSADNDKADRFKC